MISMKVFLRLLNRRLLYTYNATRSFYSISATSNTGCERFLKPKQAFLSAANSTTDLPVAKMSSSNQIKAANYDDIKAISNNKTVLLVDVREPSELKEDGVLPGSINIPLGQLENVLKNVSPDEFEKRYGRSKPDLTSPVVFSCRSGRRSEQASQTALKLGYKDVTNYTGGWLDWEKHTKAA